MTSESPRQIAIRVLRRRRRSPEYVETLLEQELARASLTSLDRSLCQELVYGIVRWEMTLDWLIARKTGPRPQSALIQLLLRLGLYQLFWLQRIPPHAAVHETVELAKHLGCRSQTGFLNALLRACAREHDALLRQLHDLQQTDPPLGWSQPPWLVQRWQTRWGLEKTAQLLQWNNTPPPTFARLNHLKTDPATLTAHWQSQGIPFTPRHWDWTGQNLIYELSSHPNLATWPDFQNGSFYIQDPSTLLAVHQLNPQPGEHILDLCAAPGGKTTYIAQLMQNRGAILAHDTQPARLDRLRENCARLGVTCVQTGPDPAAAAPFDRILVDAPCSNTGVLRRRVDLRWRLRPAELTRLPRAQAVLLAQAAQYLKPGGTLVYSTCSLEPEENETLITQFLATHPQHTLKSQRQTLPFLDTTDGAYTATLRRAP